MPYIVRKDGRCPASKPWGVMNEQTLDLRGCHETKQQARQQQEALYVNVPDARPQRAYGPPPDLPPAQGTAPEDVPKGDRLRTAAHLASTTLSALGHVSRHLAAAVHADSPASREFNLQHAVNHVHEAVEHHQKMMDALSQHNPAFGQELSKLTGALVPHAAKAAVKAPAGRALPTPEDATPEFRDWE